MKKQNIIMGISFVLLFVMVMGVSYAAYKFSAAGTKENVISTGTISMSYKQNSFIDLKNTYPKTDIYAIGTKEDKSSMEFSVSMETSGTTTINYALALTEIQEGETLKSDKVKIYLEKEGKVVNNFEENKGQTIESFKNKYVEGLIDNYAIYQDVLTTSKETHNYTLTAWIDESYILPIKNETTTSKETNQETYKFKVKVVGVDSPITIEEISTDVTGIASQVLPTLTSNVGDSGLYTITHEADSTLQIGTNEDITEYRYRGASPKNYVTFNNEVWRILGVFPTDDGTGKIENRIKLIKNESIGNYYWNNCKYNGSVGTCNDTKKAVNDWTGATLNTYLNGTYLNNLNNNSRSQISNVKHYLGGIGTEYDASVVQTSQEMYKYERKIKNTVDNEYYYSTNPNNWVGKIALMYVSDYGYATKNCENSILYGSNGENDLRACDSVNWLYDSNIDQWMLNQDSSKFYLAFGVLATGRISSYPTFWTTLPVRPVLYLKSNVKITGGTGVSTDPYTLGI